jgi:hypothetical protein
LKRADGAVNLLAIVGSVAALSGTFGNAIQIRTVAEHDLGGSERFRGFGRKLIRTSGPEPHDS